jgi:hypothetical protein
VICDPFLRSNHVAQAQTKQPISQTEPATTPLEALHRSRAQLSFVTRYDTLTEIVDF